MSADSSFQDLRHAGRLLVRRPGRAVAVIASLALVIGANVSVFSYLSFLLWQDLPVRDPGSLVSLTFETPAGAVSTSTPDYLDLREQSRGVLAGMAASGITSAAVDTGPETLHAWLHLVTGNYLPLLGVDARFGRLLGEEDDRAGAGRAVVLGHGFWTRAFGGDRAAVGRTVRLNGHVFTVVGVMPESFVGTGLPADAYVTVSQEALLRADGRDHRNDRDYAWLGLVGRLRPGVGLPAAQGALSALAARLRPATPETSESRLRVEAAGKRADPATQAFLLPTAWKTFGFVVLLLLLACANVANLLIAGTATRRAELSVRVALGASRWRLVRGLLAESVLLALLGGVLGVAPAVWGVRRIELFLNTPTGGMGSWGAGWADLPIDGRVLAFALGLSLLTGLAAGLLPALRASSQTALLPAIKGHAVALRGRLGRFGVREVLVVTQVALSAALLAGTGLFARSLQRIYDLDPGFRMEKVVLASLSLSERPGETAAERRESFRSIEEEIAALPGVASASLVMHVPLSGLSRSVPVEAPDHPGEVTGLVQVVSPGFFTTMGIPLQGNDFSAADTPETPPVALVSAGLARRLWPGRSPLGRQIRLSSGTPGEAPRDHRVVGLVGDVRQVFLWEPPPPMVYLSFTQTSRRRMTLAVRAAGDPEALIPPLRHTLARREVALIDIVPFSAQAQRSLWPQRMNVELLAVFGGLGLALASLGIAGAMSAAVSRRTREIGIRMALGATRREVLWRELGRALALIALGAALGLAATLASAKLLAGFVPGIETVPEPLVLAAVALVLFGVGGFASWQPAWRAAQVDPLVVLKG